MATQASEKSFLPALRFRALTPFFDGFIRVTMRERAFKGRLLAQIEAPPDGALLDLGAGTGTLALQMAERWPQARVTGLDADPEILAIARRKAARTGASAEFVEGFSTELPFADGSFDAVTSTLFFHHLTTEAKATTLREVVRVLKPGGALHVADFGRGVDPLQRALYNLVRGFDGFEVTGVNARGELPGMCVVAGLERTDVRARMRTMIGTLDLISAEKPR